MAACSIGILAGASVGAAYVGGRIAHDATARQDASRLQQVANASASGDMDALDANGQAIDASALNIAMRFSRYGGAGTDNAWLAQTQMAQRLSDDARNQRAGILRASLTTALSAAEAVSADSLTGGPVTGIAARAAAAMNFKAHSQSDSDCLTQAVYYEARGEGTDGMRAVAQVILNRVRHPAYPHSICGVVYQGVAQHTSCQFSFACNGAMTGPVEAWAWRRARDVANAALGGYVMRSVGTATGFHVATIRPVWAGTMDQVAQIGNHVFYQFRGRGSAIAGIDRVQPSDGVPDVTVAADSAATPVTTATTPASTTSQLNSQARVDSISVQPKPITLASHVTGPSAQAIIAAVAQPTGETARGAPQ